MKQIKALPPLANDQVRGLLARAREGDSKAREQLLAHNLLLVKKLAARFTGADQQDDLFQVGAIGLLKAIDQFDLERDVSFSTYAVPKILGEIRMYLRSNNPVKVSRELLKTAKTIRRCRTRLEQELGREPTLAELADRLALPVEEIAAAETALEPPADLDQVAASHTIDINRLAVRDIINRLEPRERQVITLRYFSQWPQAKVADKLNISQAHVSRIERAVLAKLKAVMAEEP